jgi:hypothetical protein
MFQVLYSGRAIVLDSPLTVEEVTRRLQQRFDGTFADGRLSILRRVRGRNSFRPVVEGQVVPRSAGSRLDLRMRLHPLVLVFGAIFALIAGTIAAIAAPAIPVVGSSPLLIRLLAMVAVAVIFAALGNVEVRTSTRLLSELAAAKPAVTKRHDPEIKRPLRTGGPS